MDEQNKYCKKLGIWNMHNLSHEKHINKITGDSYISNAEKNKNGFQISGRRDD